MSNQTLTPATPATGPQEKHGFTIGLTALGLFTTAFLLMGLMGLAALASIAAQMGDVVSAAQHPAVMVINEQGEIVGQDVAGPTANQVVTAALRGIDFSEVDTKNEGDAVLSTTVLEALDSDLASNEQQVEYQQNMVIRNGDTANTICVGATTWAGTCAALTLTCRSGATTDGITVAAGERRSLRFLGTERPCIVGSGSIAEYDVERITYRGTDR